jgi:(1->4)-alpha-D-glucan 1-alpha-D-glucosylmutase
VQVLVDASAAETITTIYQKFTGITDDFATLVYEKKKLTMQLSLRSEVTALGRLLDQLSELHRHYRDFTRNTLTSVVNEVIACFPVYRTYVGEEGVISPEDEKVVLRAIIAARRRNPSIEKAAFDFLRNVLMLRLPETLTPEERERHLRFVMKFQQCSGPVMAKGLEDTAFYHYNRLVALNEVGGDPGQFGFVPEEFHRLNAERQERSPNSMLATSTHDTKRSEGVRMRLAVLSEIPAAWRKSLLRWSKWNQKHHTLIEGEAAPSANEEYLLYQALLGTWPLEPFADEEARTIYRERIQQYMLKAIKEAKVNSSWTEPNEAWEQALSHFVESLLDPKLSRRFLAELAQFADQIAAPGALNSLAETILKCTAPGVPDLYQGTEIWDFSLVDPDNRRPVDYEHRRALLASLENATPAELLADWTSGRIKLFVVQRLLHFRRAQAEFFRKADYRGLAISGAQANNLLGFTRRWESGQLLVLVPRLTTRLGFPPLGSTWRDTAFSLEDDNASPWENVFTGATIELPGRQALVAPVLADFPFAVLWRAS